MNKATETSPSTRRSRNAQSGFVRELLRSGLVTEQLLEELDAANGSSANLVKTLAETRAVAPDLLAKVISQHYAVPRYDIEQHNPESTPSDLVDPKLVKKHRALPLFSRGNRLYIGVADPGQQEAITEIRFQTGVNVEPIVVDWDKLEQGIDRYFHVEEEEDLADALGDLEDTSLEDIDISGGEDETDEDLAIGRSEAEEAPIVRFINKVLLDAIRMGASDIHFEPYEKNSRIRLRIDGILQEVTKPPANLAPRIAARLKVMARLNISERRVPQDGRIKLRLSKNRAIDFRVNTLPTLYGEKIVLRILDSSAAKVGIDALGFEPDQREDFEHALSRSQGMILVTGPTGSGKTVTLYTGLGILNDTIRNISTAEDPVEINWACPSATTSACTWCSPRCTPTAHRRASSACSTWAWRPSTSPPV